MIYLDNSATTRQYDEVTDIMIKCMKEDFGNPSSLYLLGVDSEKIIKKARKQILDAAGVPKDWQVVFTSGGTEADNMAIIGTARALRRQGNRIVTTSVEHPAVLECCSFLEREGFEVVKVGVDRNCRLNMDEVKSAINDQTILVTMMHVNNEAGTIMPVDKVKAIMKEKGAPGYVHCDAVQSFGKIPLVTGVDMISLSGHKIHGPKGSGALLIRNGVNIPAFVMGGGQEKGMRSGTENVAAIAGLGLAAQMSADSMKKDMAAITEMRERLIDGLSQIGDITINSVLETGNEADMCCPTLLNVTFMKTRGEVLLHTLEQHQIYVSTGSACSSNKKGQSHVLGAMGLKDKEIEGTLRFSLGRFNTMDDIDFAIKKVTEAVNRFRRLGSFR